MNVSQGERCCVATRISDTNVAQAVGLDVGSGDVGIQLQGCSWHLDLHLECSIVFSAAAVQRHQLGLRQQWRS